MPLPRSWPVLLLLLKGMVAALLLRSAHSSVASSPRARPAARGGGFITTTMAASSKSSSSSGGGGGGATLPRRRKEYKTLVAETQYEDVIKKSRFLTHAAPCKSFLEAQEFLRRVSDPKATHNCWAYRSQGGEERSSDDGEPSGTAGRPMLAGIESEGLADVMVVVTRYFGGVKLGAGGLVRAYGGVTRNCLRAAETVTKVPRALVRAKAPLSLAGSVFQTITRAGGDKVREDYTPEEVIVDIRLEYTGPGFMDELQGLMRDATKGAGEVAEVVEEEEEGEGEGDG